MGEYNKLLSKLNIFNGFAKKLRTQDLYKAEECVKHLLSIWTESSSKQHLRVTNLEVAHWLLSSDELQLVTSAGACVQTSWHGDLAMHILTF